MTQRGGRLTGGTLLALVVAVLATADVFLIIDDRMPVMAAHAIVIGALVVAAVKVLLDGQRRALRAEIEAVLEAARQDRTVPLRVVASAAVRSAAVPIAEIPPDNVLAFDVGRQIGRQESHD
jgi:hypothetical protein